jgi:hypothetical protein
MPGGPCFKRGGPLFGGQSLLLRRRRNSPFHHGQEVFLKALSSSLRPCEEAALTAEWYRDQNSTPDLD